jgi:hypothetical protein
VGTMLDIVNAAAPVFVNVTTCGALCEPMVSFPNDKPVGESTAAAPADCVPIPVTAAV